MKKIIIWFLVVCSLTLTSCSLYNGEKYAPNGLAYKVNDDRKTCTIVGIGNCTDTVVCIPEKIGKYTVTVIGKDAFLDQTQITAISLPDGLISIEDSAFSGCTGLTKVIMPDTVTYAGIYAFGFCDNLKEIKLSNGLTAISVQLCYMCKSLEEIVIPDNVKEIGDGAFAECPLRSISLGSGVEKIQSFGFLNHGEYGFYSLSVTYSGTLAQWKKVECVGYWIQEVDCSFACFDFNGDLISKSKTEK